MPKVSPIQSDFIGGEFSPLLKGRIDSDLYKKGLDTCENYIPILQGPVVRRSGTQFINEVKTSSAKTRLVAFEFSVTQAYIIEFGNQYLRFYRNYGQIQATPSVAYEISTPYTTADLFELNFEQSADTLYIAHPDYFPRKLERSGHTAWSLLLLDLGDGPYLPENPTSTTLTPSAASGSGITLTASATTGINGGAGFSSDDVGRYIRMLEGTTWGIVVITGYTSSTVVTCDVTRSLTNTNAKTAWRMDLWNEFEGYPGVVTFHEDRLCYSGMENYPQRVDMSETGEYESFAPTELDDEIIASNAVSFTLNATDVNAVRWMLSDEKGLILGTVGGEWIVRPSSQGEALTPTNVTAKRSTTFGSAAVQAIQLGKAGLFVQRAGRKIREITYYFDVDGFRAPDLTVLAEHVTTSGVVEMARTKEPQPILWCARTDGVLAGLTYERETGSFKAAWHRHIIGGQSDAAGTDSIVESVAAIPSENGNRDDLWMIVQRYVDGGVVRYIEYLTKIFDDATEQKDGFFVDSGLTYDNPKTITGISQADPAVVTAANDFNNGDKVLISAVKGMTDVNTESYLVQSATTASFEITDLTGNDIDSTAFGAYVSGGEVRKYVTNLSGLSHLEGEEVAICADGAVQPNKTVSSGAITLTNSATTVHIGLAYNSNLKMLRIDAGSADGTSIGKTRRIHRVAFMFHRTLGIMFGDSFDNLEEIIFRTSADKMGRATALYTGLKEQTIDMDYDTENQICVRQNTPLPGMILAIAPQMNTQDR